MNGRPLASLGFVLLWSGMTFATGAGAPPANRPVSSPAASATPTAAPTPEKRPIDPGAVLDAGRFLPDTTVLLRVGDRVTLIRDFVDGYLRSDPEFRPPPDSAGRAEFLKSLINKEVLGLTALSIGRPLDAEDRTVMRGHTERVLTNVLYQRAVRDSVLVTEEDVRLAHAQYGWQQRLRHIQFADPLVAATVRRALVENKIRWSDAVTRYSTARSDSGPDGDMGWLARASLDPQISSAVGDLRPAQLSPVVRYRDGFHIIQCAERRPVEPPAFEPMRRFLGEQLRSLREGERAGRLREQVAARIGLTYDTTNILWSAPRFRGFEAHRLDSGGAVLNLSGELPEFAAADTARGLARHRGGRFTLGDFLRAYQTLSPILRQPVGDFETFRAQLEAMVLEPYLIELARARGLERDSMTVAGTLRKREEILVGHLYQDSVRSKVTIPPGESRHYYDQHVAEYVTFPRVRFASIVRPTRRAADSLLARLDAGASAADILRADSLAGMVSGSIREMREDERSPYHDVLFNERRPGRGTLVGPDRRGTFMVLQVLDFVSGRQLTYEDARRDVDESLGNIHAEAALLAFIARHAKRYRIEAHPELLMRVRLTEPALH